MLKSSSEIKVKNKLQCVQDNCCAVKSSAEIFDLLNGKRY